MKIKFLPLGFGALLFVSIFFACRKERSTASDLDVLYNNSQPISVKHAKAYLDRLIRNQGDADTLYSRTASINGNKRNEKHLDYSNTYTGENESIVFIEIPILYDRRTVAMIKEVTDPKNAAVDAEIRNASFDRFIIYKEKKTGRTSHMIVSFLPDAEYLNKRKEGLSKFNHFTQLDRYFSGYLIYKRWNGKIINFHKVYNGKITYVKSEQSKNVELQNNKKSNTKTAGIPNKNNSICKWDCQREEVEIWQLVCPGTDSQNPTPGFACEFEFTGTEFITNCVPQKDIPGGCDGVTAPGDPDFAQELKNVTAGLDCSSTPRTQDSPFLGFGPQLGPGGTEVDFILYASGYVSGATWIVFQNALTQEEYSVEATLPVYPQYPCTYIWQTSAKLPQDIPPGKYYLLISMDGDLFYNESYLDTPDGRVFRKRQFWVTR